MLRINTTYKTEPVKQYRSAKLPPAVKARYVNLWYSFHAAFPNVPLRDWCIKQNLSYGTFNNWIREPRYNKELRKAKEQEISLSDILNKEAEAAEEPEQLSLLDYLDMPLPDETEDERKACQDARACLSEEPKEAEPKKDDKEVPFPSDETEEDDPDKVTFTGPFITFTCPDYRIEISKVIPISDVNRILGFASSMMHRKAVKAANETVTA